VALRPLRQAHDGAAAPPRNCGPAYTRKARYARWVAAGRPYRAGRWSMVAAGATDGLTARTAALSHRTLGARPLRRIGWRASVSAHNFPQHEFQVERAGPLKHGQGGKAAGTRFRGVCLCGYSTEWRKFLGALEEDRTSHLRQAQEAGETVSQRRLTVRLTRDRWP
jgi:hypothetical protein